MVSAFIVVIAGCRIGDGYGECPDGAGCAASVGIPDVEHQELRSAYRQLVEAGFEVRFTPVLEDEGYAKYVEDPSMGILPEPWLKDIDPEPGATLESGLQVVITSIECPNRAEFCY
jgi:hypothetical protein